MCLIANISFAQWTVTNAWDEQREGIPFATNVLNALTERVLRYSDKRNMDMVTNFYRGQRDMLESAKLDIRRVLGDASGFGLYFYFNTNDIGTFNGNTNEYFFDVVDRWSKIEICEYLELPTNYLDETPYRMLNGWGTFTNEAGFSRPYGYTNEWTTNGGTTLPAGQPYWTTADYGWQGCKDIIDELVWLYMFGTGIDWQPYGIGGTNEYYGQELEVNTWLLAQSGAESAFAPAGISRASEAPYMYSVGSRSVSPYAGVLSTRSASIYIVWNAAGGISWDAVTNYVYDIEFYNRADEPPSGNYKITDVNGMQMIAGAWTNHETITFSYVLDFTNASTVVFGTNQFPNWVPEPVASTNNIGQGFTARGGAVMKLDSSTNGFKYVK